MASVTAPGRRSLLGAVISAVQTRHGRPSRVAQLAVKVREHITTVVALTAVDVGAFHVPAGWGMFCGLVVTGFSVLVLDFAVTGR